MNQTDPNQVNPQPAPPPMTDAMRQEIDRQTLLSNLARRARSGISNFYWIAGLSAINSLTYVFGACIIIKEKNGNIYLALPRI